MFCEIQRKCFQLRFNFTESHWRILMTLLCTSSWDKCLLLDVTTSRPKAETTYTLFGKQRRCEMYSG